MKELLVIVALIVLAFTLWAGMKSMYAFMAIAFLCFIGLLFFANLDQIEKFSASRSGFEATTRVIKEAESTIEELRQLAKLVSATTLSMVQRTGRFGTGFDRKEQEEIRDSLLDYLTKLKISQEEQAQSLSEWHSWVCRDYVDMIISSVEVPRELYDNAEIKELQSIERNSLPPPSKIEEILSKYSLMKDETRELIQDYQYYLKNKQHRRPKVWFKE